MDENINELAEDVFKMPAKTGRPDSINGIIDIINNPRYSTSIWIIKYAIENKDTLQGSIDNNYKNNFLDKINDKIINIKKFLNIK